KGIAAALAKAGAAVAIHERQPSEAATAVATALAGEHGVRTALVMADFRDPTSIAPMFAAFDRVFDSIDILVNNAGFEVPEAAEAIVLDAWEDVLRVN